MGWKDQVQENFTRSNRPEFDFKRVEIKENQFVYYDSDARDVVQVDDFEGILFGKSYELSSFDSKYSKNGGTYRSSLIFDFKQENINIFSPSGTRVFVGNYQDAKEFIDQSTDSAVRFKIVFFVKTESETFGVYSNGIIGIDQINEFGSKFTSNLFSFTPATLDFKNPQISKKALVRFDKVKKLNNPPKFVLLTLSSQITDDIEERFNIEETVPKYKEWEKYYCLLKSVTEDTVDTVDKTYEHEVREQIKSTETDIYEKTPPKVSGEGDSLPF